MGRPVSTIDGTGVDSYHWMDLAEEAGQLREAMATRAPIEQAKGVLALLRGATAEQAYAELRGVSMNANVKLRDLAAAVMALVADEDVDPADPEVRRALPLAEQVWGEVIARNRRAAERPAGSDAATGTAGVVGGPDAAGPPPA